LKEEHPAESKDRKPNKSQLNKEEATTQEDLKIGNAIIAEANTKLANAIQKKEHAAAFCRPDDIGTRAEKNNGYHKAFAEHS